MRVLVVEDDRALGIFLQKGLEAEGHYAHWVGDGEAALLYAAEDPPDLIVLDLGLPKLDGMEVLAGLQARHDDASVLVLTGRSDLQARVKCLDLGADDCLLKPFSFLELIARCHALLRRRRQSADPVLHHRDLELHRIDHKVMRAGRSVDLTTREFALLECLLRHRGECLSRVQLLAEVWGTSAETGTNIVDVYINYLRRKVDDADPQTRVIETVRGLGYRIGLPLKRSLDRPPVPLVALQGGAHVES
jgi:DNA-binding response OmpR family regulator